MNDKISLRTEKELNEKEAWEHLIWFYGKIIYEIERVGSFHLPRLDYDEKHAVSNGICCAMQHMNLSKDAIISMKGKINLTIDVISKELGMRTSYLCEVGTYAGIAMRRAFCKRMLCELHEHSA